MSALDLAERAPRGRRSIARPRLGRTRPAGLRGQHHLARRAGAGGRPGAAPAAVTGSHRDDDRRGQLARSGSSTGPPPPSPPATSTSSSSPGPRRSVRPDSADPGPDAVDAPTGPPDPVIGDGPATGERGRAQAGLIAPIHLYALFESVLAHRAGPQLRRTPQPFSVRSWRRSPRWPPPIPTPGSPRSARRRELSEITADNRLISEPYSKNMCAMFTVDQGAAVVVTSLAAARRAGARVRRRLLLVGCRVHRRAGFPRRDRIRGRPRP